MNIGPYLDVLSWYRWPGWENFFPAISDRTWLWGSVTRQMTGQNKENPQRLWQALGDMKKCGSSLLKFRMPGPYYDVCIIRSASRCKTLVKAFFTSFGSRDTMTSLLPFFIEILCYLVSKSTFRHESVLPLNISSSVDPRCLACHCVPFPNSFTLHMFRGALLKFG